MTAENEHLPREAFSLAGQVGRDHAALDREHFAGLQAHRVERACVGDDRLARVRWIVERSATLQREIEERLAVAG